MNIKKYYKTYRVLPPDYFYFETADGGENILNFYLSETLSVAPNFHIYYSLDLVNWIDLGSTYNKSSSNPLSLRYSGKVFLRANTSTWCTYRLKTYYVKIYSQKNVNAGGNIMSLLYGSDFENKTSITADWALNHLFSTIGYKLLNVNNLKLPATTLSPYCYANMFNGCSYLTDAPVLPATTLADHCYENMFRSCGMLKYIKADFLTAPSSTYMSGWVTTVRPTGTFVKNPDATWENTFGNSAIPSGWTVVTE